MNRKLRRKLDIVWKNADGSRFVAKASPGRGNGLYLPDCLG